MSAVQVYRGLVRLYPSDYRALFALEMQNALERAAAERGLLGRSVFIRFLLREFVGLLWGAGAEWVAKLTTDTLVRSRSLPDSRFMRSAGGFPALSLAGACRSDRVPKEIMEAQARVSTLIQRMGDSIANHDFPGVRRYSDEERLARNELRCLRRKYGIADFGNH